MTVIGKEGAWPREATTWFSFREAEKWVDFSNGKDLALLVGDPECGPLIELTSRPPEPDEMPRAPAHGHASDNWRITIQGTTNMGTYAYGPGQFRFQDGGVPYAGDNLAWGPEGGFGIIMFADRRGSPIRFVEPDHPFQEGADQGARAFADAYGFELRDPCPGAPAIRTNLGKTQFGHLDTGFEDSESWPEAAPGVRLATSLLGEVTAGPVLALLRCDPGAPACPAGTVDTEVFHAVVAGSCEVGGSTRTLGDAWLTSAGPQPEVVAGPDGLSHIVVFADRRAVGGFAASGDAAGQELAASLLRETATLSAS